MLNHQLVWLYQAFQSEGISYIFGLCKFLDEAGDSFVIPLVVSPL